jgi:hypothetical protein
MYPVLLITFSYPYSCDLRKKWNLLVISGTGNDQVIVGPSGSVITSAGSTSTNTLLPRRLIIGNDSWHARPVPTERSKGDQTSIDIYSYYDTNFTITGKVCYFEWVACIQNRRCRPHTKKSPGKENFWQRYQVLLLLRFRVAPVLIWLTYIAV